QPVFLNGGTLGNLTGSTPSAQSGTVTLQANSVIDSGVNAFSITGVIGESGGSWGMTKTGTGTLTLTAANTFTGDTILSGGTLSTTILNNPLGQAIISTNVTIIGNGDTRLRLG